MKTVLTGGKFNRIHQGHVWLLHKAKSLGDRLVVVLAHDSHNNREYAVAAEQRKKNVESLGIADHVVIGDPKDFFIVVEKYMPDIIVLGYDQKLPFEEKCLEDLEKLHGKRIRPVKLEKHGDYSSGKML